MKRTTISALLCGITMIAALPAVSAFAADSPEAKLLNTGFQTAQAQDFTTTVYLPENSNISDFQAVLSYDPACVKLVKATAVKADAGQTAVNAKEDGTIFLTYSATENQNDRINLVELTFHVPEDLAEGKYDFLTLSSSGNSASSLTEEGKFTDVKLSEDFSALNIYEYGDANLDGKVQSRDVTFLKQYIVKTRELSELSKIYSNAYLDFEEDGVTPKINSRDAGMIQQKVVRMDVALGNRVSVTFYDADGNLYAKKSIPAGSELKNVPELPFTQGIEDGIWSLSADEAKEADFSKVKSDMEVYFVGKENPNRLIYERTVDALETGFAQAGKYIVDDFQLPYKNHYGTFNMLSSSEFSDVDIIWSIDSGLLAQSVNISKEYVVDVPMLDYTTWVTFTANIYVDGVEYGKHPFKREIKGTIDMPSPDQFEQILEEIPENIQEHYRLPGYISLESSRLNYGVRTVQNVDMKWTVVKNADGSTGDPRCLDGTTNELIYLKDENTVTLQCDFMFEDNVVYTGRIVRTLPEKSIEGQVEYAKQYISSFVPSVISGETYFPTTVPLYDLTVSWEPPIETGKVEIGRNETVQGQVYKVISVGEKAGYMEWSTVYANIERNGDDRFKRTGAEFEVQLAGNSTEITMDKIPDSNLYKALVSIFDQRYGNHDGILTEEEIYSTDTMEKLNYTLDLSNKGIQCLSGIRYLKNYRILNFSDNDLSGTNASLGDLASLNQLVQLSLSNCGISEIPDSVFSSKFLIEGIDLSYNKLTNLNFLRLTDSRTQADLAFTELKELFLQGNYISDITELAFENTSGEYVSRIPNVTTLTLSRDLNYVEYKKGEKLGKKVLKTIEEYDYDITTAMDITPLGTAKKLSTLWLANNFITDISPLANCKLLATLDLSGNAIKADTKTDGLAPLSKLQSLVCLLLDGNDLHTVKSLRKLIYLDVLSLSNNSIGNVSGILDGMSHLTYLDLDGNELTSFDASSFPLLKRLYLEDNELVQVMNLDTAPGLTELRLNHNNVSPETISSLAVLTNLEYLSLSGNKVENLPFLQNLTALKHLELAGCELKQVRPITRKNEETGETVSDSDDNIAYFKKLTDLKVLDLSDNPDVNDISALSSLTNLGVFYINHVTITDASPVRAMTKLEYLSMQDSGLTDFSFLNTLNQLRYLNLAGHNAALFDFRYIRNCDYLVGLFLDSAADTTEVQNFNSFINKVELKYLALANMQIGTIDSVPDMDNLVYLGLRNTGIADFNGKYSETDGYLFPITRFDNVKYLDVASNPQLFTKPNLETLFDYARKPSGAVAVMLYRDDAPEGYVPGIMDAKIEAKRLKNDINFGEGGTDISAALKTGYVLQSTLDGYKTKWNLEENDNYYIEDGKLYFKNTDAQTAELRLGMTMDIVGLYYREDIENSQKQTPVSFNASIQTTTTKQKTGEQKFVKTETATSSEPEMEGWKLVKTDMGYTEYGEWSDWSEKKITETDLREVESKEQKGYGDWGEWSSWSDTAVSKSDTRDVDTQTVTRSRLTGYNMVYYLTQGANSPYYRHYREFSIAGNLGAYGARTSYGEHNGARTATVDEVNNATKIAPGGYFNGSYNGYISGNATAYVLPGDNGVPWFISSEIHENYNVTQYRYRERKETSTTVYRFRDRTLVPTVYHFERDIYEDIYEDVISGMTLVVE